MSYASDMFVFDDLREAYDIEAKLAIGKDGKGEIPKSLWETYSAMANTDGGIILLGVEELQNGHFAAHNIKNVDNVLKNFWNTINNQQKVNRNILADKDVSIIKISDSAKIIRVNIPRATRQQKPVFVGQNPFGGTYQRNNDGDFRCQDDIVKQMLAEQGSNTRDSVICPNYGISDIDLPTFQSYRQLFHNVNPDHVFNTSDDIEFLRQIGGWRQDRNSLEEGLTIAGLLMFGKLRSIWDNIPNYIVDYQERPRAITELRWIDRITTDGKWAGNLFSFYQIVIKKLFADLKIPFVLEHSMNRVDDTPVHKAVREAFVNTLIHADYSGQISILVVKRPDLFGFRNPGTLRIPKQDIIHGGTSDCRNRNLQKMFQLVGLAEQAGSGFPKICYGWDSQAWKTPELDERFELNQTVLALRMTSLFPEEAIASASKELGVKFKRLNNLERLAVITAYSEGCVNHDRLMEISKEHTADISMTLHKIVQEKLLEQTGKGRATIYFPLGRPPELGDISHCETSMNFKNISKIKAICLPNMASSNMASSNMASSNMASSNMASSLKDIADSIQSRQRVPRQEMIQIILRLCDGQYLSIEEIAELLQRDAKSLRNYYINELCKSGLLIRKHPMKTHPDQRYISRKDKN